MAQAFVTTYRDNYRRKVQERAQPIRREKNYSECELHSDMWLIVKDPIRDETNKESFAEVQAAVKKLELQRFISTYKRSYCKKTLEDQIEDPKEVEALNNALLESCNVLFNKKIEKLLPPLVTSIRIESIVKTVNALILQHVNRTYIIELLAKFSDTGLVADQKRNTPNRIVGNAGVEVAVFENVAIDPTLSTKQLFTVCCIGRTSIRRILKSPKFHQYKLHLVQELNKDDIDKLLQFCELISEQIRNNPNLLFKI